MRARGPTLRELFDRALRRHRDRIALRMAGRTLRYAELDRLSNALARGLAGRSIRPGDRVALLLRNSLAYAIADLALIRLGAVKVPLNDMLAPRDVAYMLDHSGASALVAHASLLHRVEGGLGAHPALKTGLLVGDAEGGGEGFERFDAVLEEEDGAGGPSVDVDPAAPALLLYTGGTTGRSKGVVHSQEALALNLLAHVVEGEVQRDERMLLATPLPHSAGFHLQAGLLQGGSVTLLPGFDPGEVLATIQRERITWTFMVPTMIYRLIDSPERERYDASSLRTLVYGAAPIAPARLREALEAFGPIFLQLYGQSECPNYATVLSKEDHRVSELQGSCGQPVLCADVRVAGEDGETLPAGQVGEILLRSPYTLEFYYHAPEQTDSVYDGEWLRTGDVGYQAESGHVFLVDRAKDMIISGGMNVYSTEVESAILEHGAVRQVAVVGVPHEDWGESVHAVVVPDGGALSQEDLLEFCKRRLARYKVPKSVEIVAQLPLTAYGKIDKKALRESHWAAERRRIH